MKAIIDTWQVHATQASSEIVIPDGCCDIILKIRKDATPKWIVSSLQDSSFEAEIDAGSQMYGFRLLPGTRIQEKQLLTALRDVTATEHKTSQIIQNYCSVNPYIDEALQTLKSREVSVSLAAESLNVSQRGLQRLIKQETGKTPLFWIRLAKVRRTARDIVHGLPLGDCAFENGYADQAHMSREIKNWFGTTPSKLHKQVDIKQQLSSTAYN